MPYLRVRQAAVLACASLSLTASAQNSISLSGYLDVGVYRDAARVWQVGPIQRSHVRLDGAEDLGGGLAATLALSHRFDTGSGQLESPGKPFWHGESTVGLKGAFGAVKIGRRLDTVYNLDWEFDPWANYDRVASPAWDMWHYNFPSDPRGNSGTPEYGRLNNGVFYDSPQWAGLSVHLSASFEHDAVDTSRARGGAVRYANGPFSGVAAHERNSAGDTEAFFGAKLASGELAVMGVYDITKSGPSTARALTLGATYAVGRLTLKGGWGRLQLNSARHERMLGLGAHYALSKRTAVYADLAHKRFAARNATLPGLGIVHSF